jgi:lipopolysaccharide transport system ATP-binding protein
VSDIAVRVDHVTKSFRMYHERNQSLKSAIMRRRTSVHEDFLALDDVSFDVPVGSTFGLIGSNGSGKSTLLKCLANIYYPNKGGITHFGKIAAMLEVGSGFHAELSGRENIFLNGSILGMSRSEVTRKFDEIVDFSGVEKFIDQPVKNYSSGMYVRLGFAIAINVDPDILVVDEVLAVGDAEFQEKCFAKFEDFKADGKTVILVSHSMATVQTMCDQAAWLNHGELKAAGAAAPTIKAYIDSLSHDAG